MFAYQDYWHYEIKVRNICPNCMIEERRGKTRECVVWTAIFLLSLQIYGSILTKTGFFWESYFVLYLLQTANNIERFLSLQVNGQQCEETTKNHCYHLPQQYAHKWVSLCESNKMKGPLLGWDLGHWKTLISSEKTRKSYVCVLFILFYIKTWFSRQHENSFCFMFHFSFTYEYIYIYIYIYKYVQLKN